MLQQQAQDDPSGDAAPQLWTRIAGLLCDRGAFRQAARALTKVANEARTKRFGELQYLIGGKLGDPDMQACGSTLCAQYSIDKAQQAHWLRVAAQVQWWERRDVLQAYSLLQQSQRLVPCNAHDVLDTAADSRLELAAALRHLQTALVVVEPAHAAPLWRTLAQHVLAQPADTSLRRAIPFDPVQALWIACALARHHAQELLRVATAAHDHGMIDIELAARQRLWQLDATVYFDGYAALLEALEHWEALLELNSCVVEQPANATVAEAMAQRLETAAHLAQKHLGDALQALQLWQRACRLAPSLPRLQQTLTLAEELQQHDVMTTAAQQLLGRLAPADRHREQPLRALLVVQKAQQDAAAQMNTLRALHDAGWATLQDKQALAQAEIHVDPHAAAQLWDDIVAQMSEACAAGSGKSDWAEALYLAAQAWHAVGNAGIAATRLRMALAAGFDDARAYQLAIELFSDPAARLPMVTRYLALEGDVDDAAARRAALRLEVATAEQKAGRHAAAESLIRQAYALAPSAQALHMLEEALERDHNDVGLLVLWLYESEVSLWPAGCVSERLERAIAIAQKHDRPVDELAAYTHMLRQAQAGATEQPLPVDVTFDALLRVAQLSVTVGASGVDVDVLSFEEVCAWLAAIPATPLQLRQAGDLARQHRVFAHAYTFYRRVVDAEMPLEAAALRFCTDYAIAQERYDEAVAFLCDHVPLCADAGQAHELYVTAAGIARDYLKDAARELELLTQAFHQAPHPSLLKRLCETFVQQGEVARTLEILRAVPFEAPSAAVCESLLAQTDGCLPTAVMQQLQNFYRCHQQPQKLVDLLERSARGCGDVQQRNVLLSEAAAIYRDRLNDPMRAAELLEGVGAVKEAFAIYRHLSEHTAADAPQRGLLLAHVGRLAWQLRDLAVAQQALTEAHALQPHMLGWVNVLRQVYEAQHAWTAAADLYQEEIALAAANIDVAAQHTALLGLAALYQEHLDDAEAAGDALEQALTLIPDDPATLERLLSVYAKLHKTSKYLTIAERLVSLPHRTTLAADFYRQVAHVYESIDPVRAQWFLSCAETGGAPRAEVSPSSLVASVTKFATSVVDLYAPAPAPAPAADDAAKAAQYVALADAYLQHHGEFERGVACLRVAINCQPNDQSLVRRLADAYALRRDNYPQAAELYETLRLASPYNVALLRVLARLYGHMGQTERAYAYYACMLTMTTQPGPGEAHDGAQADAFAEARVFVQACRAARLPPAHVYAKAAGYPYAQLLRRLDPDALHTPTSVVLERFFTPLARFAEVILPDNPADMVVGEAARLAANDPRLATLQPILALMGLVHLPIYEWPGHHTCELYVSRKHPALFIGSTLLAPECQRQLHFHVLRNLELYRSGHTLCERLGAAQLRGLFSSLLYALDPHRKVASPLSAAAQAEAKRDSARIAPLLSPQIVIDMQKSLAAFAALENLTQDDVRDWAAGNVAKVNRLAMLLCCDLHETVDALWPRGVFAPDPQDAAPAVSALAAGHFRMQEISEAVALFSFSHSALFATLRAQVNS